MAEEEAPSPEPKFECCVEEEEYLKIKEECSTLEQAVRILEQSCNDLEAKVVMLRKEHEETLAETKIKQEELLKEQNVVDSLKSELSAAKAEIAALRQKCGGDEKVKALQATLSVMEKEVIRLKEELKERQMKTESEMKVVEDARKKTAETQKLLEAQKKINAEMDMQIQAALAAREKRLADEELAKMEMEME